MTKEEYLEKIIEILAENGTSDSTIEKWLNTDNMSFGGSSPMKLIEAGRGRKVLTWVEVIYAGY